MSSQLEGVWTALWTPIDAEGKLIKPAIKHHIELLKKAGVHGIVVGGSTGEFRRITLQCRLELLEWVVACAGSMPVMVNISVEILDHLKPLAKAALEHKVAGVLVLPPSFYPVSQQDLIAYFTYVSKLTKDLPFILYNFPECIRNPIEAETIIQLSETIQLAGIKQSGSSFEYHRELAEIGNQKGFIVFTGSDSRLPDAMQMGVGASIGGLTNAIPELIVEVFKKVKSKQNCDSAQHQIDQIKGIIKPLFFPYDVGALMQARGLEIGVDKTIRSAQSKTLQAKVVEELKALEVFTNRD